ncbi:MAG: tRNA pseudouridine32 synthase/23S rRNA pseudouridine746 synthase [Bacteroidia bacterium]|jgi:tRNA pseudouridine32 synthase/23S rRNA pseudouridine746 synthase
MPNPYFHLFQADISTFDLPEKFTFPYSYEPLPITLVAVQEVQAKLQEANLKNEIAGKMFGVLLVQNEQGELGYLVAFSGQLGGEKYPMTFVPSVFDRLQTEGFFKKGEEELIQVNQQIVGLENDYELKILKQKLKTETEKSELEIATELKLKQLAKAKRKEMRERAKPKLSDLEFEELDKTFKSESTNLHYNYKKLRIAWKEKLDEIQQEVDGFENEIERMKTERKEKSIGLHHKILNQYQFLNKDKISKGLPEIFADKPQPPAGAGDCAAPKLLQFAFKHGFKPISIAEFWWGKTPKSEIRHQGKYYPACHSKCRPILTHMLEGILLEDDPLAQYSSEDKKIETVFEDKHLLVVNKPAGLLSVPSKEIDDSVLIRLQQKYPELKELSLVHRLDQLTSGLLVIAKSMAVYKAIQSQFIKRSIEKQYVAILEGEIFEKEGFINLPLDADEERKPLQKVNYETGKPSRTEFKILSISNGRTRIQFKPITGRTHQLRVHAAHKDGLNTPIVGDILYGNKDERLLLHAEFIVFKHPITHKRMSFEVKVPF